MEMGWKSRLKEILGQALHSNLWELQMQLIYVVFSAVLMVCKGNKSCVCRYVSVATIWESEFYVCIMLLRIVRIPMRLNKGFSPIVSLQ